MSRSFVRTVFWLVGIFGGIAVLLHLFVFDTMVVPGDSPLFVTSVMPTLAPGDLVLVRRGGVPHDGQLARCASPDPTVPYVIGRVMGEGGETVEMSGERALINGRPFPSRHGCPPVTLAHPVSGGQITLACQVEDNGASTYPVLLSRDYPEGTRMAVVEAGKLYLVSDNRHIHMDSRDFGLVDASTCEHVVFRLWGERFTDASRRFTVLY